MALRSGDSIGLVNEERVCVLVCVGVNVCVCVCVYEYIYIHIQGQMCGRPYSVRNIY